MTPRQIEKIKKQIKSERAFLAAEKRKFGGYFDNRGRRYVIAELYSHIQDYKGVLRYYNWFYKEFPDDIGFPELHLSWIIAAIKEKKSNIFNNHLIHLEAINSYIIPEILGIKQLKTNKWEGMGLSTIEYAKDIKEVSKEWIDTEIINVLEKITSDTEYQRFKSQMIQFDIQFSSEDKVSIRAKILKKREQNVKNWIECLMKK